MEYNKYKSRRALFNAIMKEVRSRPVSYKITQEPDIFNYGLTHEDEKIVTDFNLKQEKRRSVFQKRVWIFIGILCVLSFFDYFNFLILIWGFIGLFPFTFLLIDSASEKIYKNHHLYEKLKKFKNDESEYKSYLKMKEREFWINLTGHQFEYEIGKLLKNYFDNVKVTQGSGDGGVDIIIDEPNQKIIIQCKNHKSRVGPEPVRALKGVLSTFGAKKAVMISTNGYTPGAINFSKSINNMYLYDLEDIIKWTKGSDSGYIHFTNLTYSFKK